MTLTGWSAAFVLGAAAALGGRFAPGQGVPGVAFWLLCTAGVLGTASLGFVIGRRGTRAAWAIGPAGALFLSGALLGGAELERQSRDTPSGVPPDDAFVTLEGALLEDSAPATSAVRLRLHIGVIEGQGKRSAADFDAYVYAQRLVAQGALGRAADSFRYGDRYRVEGRFRRLEPDDRRVAGRISVQEIELIGEAEGNAVRRAVARYRQSLSESMRRAIAGDAGALAVAMVTGDRRGMPESLADAYRQAGTAHMLAISGMNITLLGVLTASAAAWAIGRRWQVYLLVPVLAVWGYAALAGLGPPVIRAAIMFTVYLAATAFGRQRSALPAIGLAAALMIAASPEVIGSVSFQLSFVAIAGIVAFTPDLNSALASTWRRLTDRQEFGRIAEVVILSAATGIAATVAVVPLSLFYFGSFAVWGAVATLLALPALGILILSGVAAGLIGTIVPAAGQVTGWLAWLTGEYMNRLSEFFAWLPPGAIAVRAWSVGASAAAYAALAVWLFRRDLATGFKWARKRLPTVAALSGARPRWRPPIWLTGLVALAAAVLWTGAVTSRPDGLLKITFFETDVGDVILIETPNRTQALIDGGRAPGGATGDLDSKLPFWDRSLNIVLLTHGDQDHVGGLEEVLDRYRVDVIADAPAEGTTAVYAHWLELASKHPNRVTLSGGEVFALDEGIALDVVSAGPAYAGASDNDGSVVTRLRYNDVSVLLTADIEAAAEASIAAASNVRSTVLLAPHHGSDTSSSQVLLDAVAPTLVVVSAGTANPYGHPDERAVARLREAVADDRVFVTRDHGDVTVVTDGLRVWVETER